MFSGNQLSFLEVINRAKLRLLSYCIKNVCGGGERETRERVLTQQSPLIGRKTLRDQLHQSVQTEDSSFSLSPYLQTSHSFWIRSGRSGRGVLGSL